MDGLITLLGVLAWGTWIVRVGLVVAQMYQIEEYEWPRLLGWGHKRSWLFPTAVLAGSLLALGSGMLASLTSVAGALGLLVGAAVMHILWRRTPAKKPLIYTPRMRRMLGASLTLLVLFGLIVAALLHTASPPLAVVLATFLCLSSMELALWLIITGDKAMAPVEAAIQRGFVRQAKARVQDYRPRTVGIAGSYGKTSTKHILAQLTAPQIETLPTPKSFNTLMGITRTINEHLESTHRLFLVEMDAYDVGEIRAMSELVAPELAVITSVGPQHLERFGTVERIGDALYELVEALPAGKPAVIYAGEPESARLAERAAAAGYEVVRYGLGGESSQPLDIVATAVTVDERATHFTWRWPARGKEARVSIPLLGQHNILNVSAALAIVELLGLSVDKAVQEAARLEAVPHRLQLLPSPGGVTVIDDSYNANPVGVHNGLEVLAQMRGKAKILVTPGLVELG
nr:UDP-N-acetylmuramoyl-tripeptide--D-alanyl-D-alanine ligase [Ardenticatenales bacterium]